MLLRELKTFKGTVVWKSTTAIHLQDIKVMGAFRRYLTDQVNADIDKVCETAKRKHYDVFLKSHWLRSDMYGGRELKLLNQ